MVLAVNLTVKLFSAFWPVFQRLRRNGLTGLLILAILSWSTDLNATWLRHISINDLG
jgi:hypothetical protein